MLAHWRCSVGIFLIRIHGGSHDVWILSLVMGYMLTRPGHDTMSYFWIEGEDRAGSLMRYFGVSYLVVDAGLSPGYGVS